MGVEGGDHNFTPCKPKFRDTKMPMFDFINVWLIQLNGSDEQKEEIC